MAENPLTVTTDIAAKRVHLLDPSPSGRELKYVEEAVNRGEFSLKGKALDQFNSALRAYTGSKHILMTNSGTAAIHLALRILDVQPGDYVICQSFTFAGTVNPVLYQGAIPVLIGSEHNTWNMDPNSLEDTIKRLFYPSKPSGIGGRLSAIIPVHLYGTPAKMNEIMDVANKYDIPVIEDAAEALGARYHDRHVGQHGAMTVLSFNGNKMITTGGGGALLSENQDWIDKAKFLATQARDDAPHYQHSTYGYNYRMGNINAAIGLGQMDVLDERVNHCRQIYQKYKKELGEIFEFPEEPKGLYSNRWLTCILTESYEQREKIRLTLDKQNIESRPLWKPMHLQPVFKDAPYFGNTVEEDLFNKGLCLPSGSSLTDRDLERVINEVKKAL